MWLILERKKSKSQTPRLNLFYRLTIIENGTSKFFTKNSKMVKKTLNKKYCVTLFSTLFKSRKLRSKKNNIFKLFKNN